MKVVSVVVPVESRLRTIRSTVNALLAQSYCGPIEVILVGEHDDPAWSTVALEIETGQVQAIEVDADDPVGKRAVGLEAASGDVLCVTDGGTVPGRHWVAAMAALSNAYAPRLSVAG